MVYILRKSKAFANWQGIHQTMMIKVKNWKLALLALVFITLFICLGFWQLSRAREKTDLLESFRERTQQPAVHTSDLNTPRDWRFYPVEMEGKFDNAHTFLLDNKTFNGKVGYEVYTPFKPKGLDMTILVDRGFIPLGVSREHLPAIPKTPKGSIKIKGILNTPPLYLAFGDFSENGKIQWPLRVEYISLAEFSKLTRSDFFPYIVSLTEDSPSALQVKWQIQTVDPNKNKGYAVQWFAFALTLLIISVVLNNRALKSKPKVANKKK
jgi:surfeit locus 1 family protein